MSQIVFVNCIITERLTFSEEAFFSYYSFFKERFYFSQNFLFFLIFFFASFDILPNLVAYKLLRYLVIYLTLLDQARVHKANSQGSNQANHLFR